jgi:hypothetical protein
MESEYDLDESEPAVRICAWTGCDSTIPADAHGRQKYCDFHKEAKNRKAPKRDKPPKSASSGLKDSELDKAWAGAYSAVRFAALGLKTTGDPDSAAILMAGAKPWADAMAELAQYEDSIRKLLVSKPMKGRTMAWVGAASATLALAYPVAHNKGIIPEAIDAKIIGFFEVLTAEGGENDRAHRDTPVSHESRVYGPNEEPMDATDAPTHIGANEVWQDDTSYQAG